MAACIVRFALLTLAGAALAHAFVAQRDLHSVLGIPESARPSSPPAASAQQHFWPTARGQLGQYSESPWAGPQNLSTALAWEWHHPEGRYHTVVLGVLIDSGKNLYLASDDALRKFDSEGNILWIYTPRCTIPAVPSLMDDTVYGLTSCGFIYALDLITGNERWNVQVADSTGLDTGFVSAEKGVVITASNREGAVGANRVVRGLNATDGTQLWDFRPDAAIWNFMAQFVGDGTFIFQDVEGRAYRHYTVTGRPVWKTRGHVGTHTDGSALLGPNGIVYSVAIQGCCCGPCDGPIQGMHEDTPGWIHAWRLEDGAALWQQTLARPPNIFPAVGALVESAAPSVVIPVGQQCSATQTDIYSFDAQTGELQWLWKGPKNPQPWCAGDKEGWILRSDLNIRIGCLPNPWSAPTIDRAGAIFTGNQNGHFYRVQDKNGDAIIQQSEVQDFDTGAAFSSPGTAHAPGMMAIASCDGLFVFK